MKNFLKFLKMRSVILCGILLGSSVAMGSSDLSNVQTRFDLCQALFYFSKEPMKGMEEITLEWRKNSMIWGELRTMLIANPDWYNTRCQASGESGDEVFEIRDLYKTYAPDIGQELANSIGSISKKAMTIVTVQKANAAVSLEAGSACSEKEVREYFTDAIELLMKTRGAARHLMAVNAGLCKLNGLVEKSPGNQFVYRVNYAGMNPMAKVYPIRFNNLSEAVVQIMATQSKTKSPVAESAESVTKSSEKNSGTSQPSNVGNAIYFPFGTR